MGKNTSCETFFHLSVQITALRLLKPPAHNFPAIDTWYQLRTTAGKSLSLDSLGQLTRCCYTIPIASRPQCLLLPSGFLPLCEVGCVLPAQGSPLQLYAAHISPAPHSGITEEHFRRAHYVGDSMQLGTIALSNYVSLQQTTTIGGGMLTTSSFSTGQAKKYTEEHEWIEVAGDGKTG